jgi:protoheme IX farnesyltransferase
VWIYSFWWGYFFFENNFSFFWGFFLAGAGASLNQIFEREEDKIMLRTRLRPLPSGKMDVITALFIFFFLFFAGIVLLIKINIFSFIFAFLAFFIYDFIYTPLKKKTSFSLFVGALVGALVPISGVFTAKDLFSVNFYDFLLPIFLYFYQLPHTLSLFYVFGDEEWRKAGFKPFTIQDKKLFKFFILFLLVLAYFFGLIIIYRIDFFVFALSLVFAIFGFVRAIYNTRKIFYDLNAFALFVFVFPVIYAVIKVLKIKLF